MTTYPQSSVYPALPFYILSAAGILAAAVTVALPETANEKLANTLDEGEQFGRGQSFFLLPFLERRRRREKTQAVSIGASTPCRHREVW